MVIERCAQVDDKLIGDFVDALQGFGFDRFYYMIVTDRDFSLREALGVSVEPKRGRQAHLRRMRFAVSSDSEILQYRDEYLRRFSKSDETFARLGPALRKRHDLYVWPENSLPQCRRESFLQFQQRFNVASRAIYYHKLPQRPGWLGTCHLFSSLPRSRLLEQLQGRTGELKSLLAHHCELFNFHSFRSINPLANMGVLSPTCIKILFLVAEGWSSDEIARELYLTERGVNYHLDRARQILMARNRVNLISKAYQKGLL